LNKLCSATPLTKVLDVIGRSKKNSSDSQKSFEYVVFYIVKPGSDLSVPIFHRDGVGTLLSVCDIQTSAGCQGFFGPFPSAFLDKRCVKNWRKDIIPFSKFPNPGWIFLSAAGINAMWRLGR
jgi:hypothetical protein